MNDGPGFFSPRSIFRGFWDTGISFVDCESSLQVPNSILGNLERWPCRHDRLWLLQRHRKIEPGRRVVGAAPASSPRRHPPHIVSARHYNAAHTQRHNNVSVSNPRSLRVVPFNHSIVRSISSRAAAGRGPPLPRLYFSRRHHSRHSNFCLLCASSPSRPHYLRLNRERS